MTSAAWGACTAGTVVAVKMQAAGYNWEIDAVDRLVVRDQQRSFESTVLLLPRTSTYNGSAVWMPSDVVLSTPARNYTVSDYPQLFRDIGYPEGRLKVCRTLRVRGKLLPLRLNFSLSEFLFPRQKSRS